jgi:hypothetical protein
MSDQIVGLTNELLTGETADINEWVIAVENFAREVCGRYQFLFCWKRLFSIGDWQILAHALFPALN